MEQLEPTSVEFICCAAAPAALFVAAFALVVYAFAGYIIWEF